ncbi:MAG: glycosyltransferase, partial [Nitrospira sp.]|nr:glycosyltransferase [Nitrospira sp.]
VVAVLPDVRFLLVGDGDMRASIETLIDRQGLRDHVYLVGWRRDVSAVMQALDVFLLTSHWEGLPRVLIEARAVGLPVVATNVGGAAEVVDHEQVGVLCRVGDIEGLATAVLRVLSNQAASANVKLKQRASLPREFHIDEMVTQYERLYERLLHARRNRMVPQATH